MNFLNWLQISLELLKCYNADNISTAADLLNDYFAKIGKKLANSYNNPYTSQKIKKFVEQPLLFRPVTTTAIKCILKKF